MLVYESAVIFKDGGVLTESCSENFLEKKLFEEFLFGKDDISREVLKMDISEFPEISKIANPDKTCKSMFKKVIKPRKCLLWAHSSDKRKYK